MSHAMAGRGAGSRPRAAFTLVELPAVRRRERPAFTLIELLVVISIMVVLLTILLPSLGRAKEMARQVTCLTQVNAQIKAVHLYASEEGGWIPLGPGTPMALPGGYTGPPRNLVATNQIWVGSLAAYDGQGALLSRKHLGQPEAFFCPDDDSADPSEELTKVRDRTGEDVYDSYLYRQLDARDAASAGKGRLSDLGLNALGGKVSALTLDMNSKMQIPGAPVRTNHRGLRVSVGFAEGHCKTYDNPDDAMTLRPGDEMRIFDRLDEILQYADGLN